MVSITAINKRTIVQRLHQGIMEITFIKADKSTRIMKCTLQPEFLPSSYSSTSPNVNEDDTPITVWDVENNGWRSIKPSTIVKVKI